MDKQFMFDILEKYNVSKKDAYFKEAFSRNIGILSQKEQQKLSNAKVAIPGMGGVGGVHLITLARSGVGKFNIADFDIFEPANINRQYGARVSEFGRPKIEVMKEQALLVNPFLEITSFDNGINEENLDEFLDDVDVVVDGLDFFQFDIRRALFKRAAEKGIYVITAGPMGFSSAMLIFSPTGMGFDKYFNIKDHMDSEQKYLSFALGLSPRPTHIKYMNLKKVSLETKAGPSMNAACQICSGMAATETLRIILERKGIRPVPHYIQFDPYLTQLRKGKLWGGNKNPVQQLKMKIINWILQKNKNIVQPKAPELPDIKIENGENIPKEVLNYLIKVGIQAPSGDNAQPWQFKSDTNSISLILNPDRDLSFFNVDQLASYISCGAVIENIRVATCCLGLETKISILPDEGDKFTVAILKFQKAKKSLLAGEIDSIWMRHTNRKMYPPKPVPSKNIRKMLSCISEIPGAKLSLHTDRPDLKKIAKIVYKGDLIRTEYRPLHEHLMTMIRFSNKEVLESQDGLPLKNLEAGFAGEWFLRLTKPWSVMRLINLTGINKAVSFHSYKSIINSSGVGLLTIEGDGPESYIRGGMALQKIWLKITSLGMVMQPMTALTLFFMRIQLGKESEFLKKHLNMLQEIKAEYNRAFPVLEKSDVSQILLFRFGYAKESEHRTYRRKFNS